MSSMTKPSVYNALQLRLIKESGNKRINLPTKLIQARRGTCIKSCRTLTRSCMITLLQIFSEQKKNRLQRERGRILWQRMKYENHKCKKLSRGKKEGMNYSECSVGTVGDRPHSRRLRGPALAVPTCSC